MAIIPDTQEVKIRGLQSEAKSGQKQEVLSKNKLKEKG
jgi:hypothetical protein